MYIPVKKMNLHLSHSHTCPVCVLHASSTPVRLPGSITYLREKED